MFHPKDYPIVKHNKQGDKIYNPDFVQYFQQFHARNYLELAQKLAEQKTNIFRHIYKENKQSNPIQYQDILQDGSLSCAVFVSNLLFYFQKISDTSASVASLETLLPKNGWKKVDFDENKDMISSIPKGAILIRANYKKNKKDFFIADYHIGFYIGNSKAISNVLSKDGEIHKTIAIHNAIRDAPKHDHYSKIQIVRYYQDKTK
ncbi:MAG: hypothetical protein GXP45_08160 [bacterium]|nr:hypothetical protein [bacterium]